MESRSHALLAGIFLLVLLAGVTAVLFWFTGDRTTRTRFEIVSRIAVSGLMVEAPVRLRGVDVGSVAAIRFRPEDPRDIVVTISVDRAAPMTKGVYAQLALWGISGLTYVALGDDGSNPAPLASDEPIEMRPSFIGQAQVSVEALLTSADIALQRFTALLSDENIARTGRTLEGLEQSVEGVRLAMKAVQSDVTQGTLGKVDTLVDLLVGDARKLDALLTNLNDRPQSLLFGRPPPRPGPGEPGFQDRKRAR